MKRFLLFAWGVLFLAPLTPGQTISPVIVEYSEKAGGKFQLYNDADIPLTVVLDPRSFSVDNSGNATFRKLDPGIHVQLSATSFRLAPKQTFYVFYKASADSLPNWFSIYATVSGATTPNGIKLAIQLPHTVYLLTRKPMPRDEVSWVRAESAKAGEKQKILAEIENRGADFSRVQEVEVTSASAKKVYSGFPLFPGQHRTLELDWDESGTPQHIVMKFPHFKLESALKESATSP